MLRIIVTGDRNWHCTEIAARVLDSLRAKHGEEFVIVHGDCPSGVDRAFRNGCMMRGIKHDPFPAQWADSGKSAGPRRNAEMIAEGADYAIAIHRNIARSKGTRDCAARCVNARIPVYLIDGVNPDRRLTRTDLEG